MLTDKIEWHDARKEQPPIDDFLLLAYYDDSGDYVDYYVGYGWYLKTHDLYIMDDMVNYNVMYWAELPKFPINGRTYWEVGGGC